jgi:hypothetical protein
MDTQPSVVPSAGWATGRGDHIERSDESERQRSVTAPVEVESQEGMRPRMTHALAGDEAARPGRVVVWAWACHEPSVIKYVRGCREDDAVCRGQEGRVRSI